MTSLSDVRPAATVIVLRDDAPGFEVLLVKRHEASSFMPGAHVFPGGRVEDADREAVPETRSYPVAAVRELFEEAGIRLGPDALIPFAHWVTPPGEGRRFDTRFFIARLLPGQTPIHDNHETVETVWMGPARALEQHGRGLIYLPPPTWTTLRELEPFASTDEALDWARCREIVRREPRFVETSEGRTLVVPGDPETRFILEDGRWWSHD